MTTQRLLSGMKRVGPDTWRWGCWKITKQQGAFGRYFWMASDLLTDPDTCPHFEYERNFITGDTPSDVLDMLVRLSHIGPDPIAQEAAR